MIAKSTAMIYMIQKGYNIWLRNICRT